MQQEEASLNVKEAADLIRRCPATVRRLVSEGALPAYKKTGLKGHYFKPSETAVALEKRAQQVKPIKPRKRKKKTVQA